MLLVRLLVKFELLVVKCGGSLKLYMDFPLHGESGAPNLCGVQGLTVLGWVDCIRVDRHQTKRKKW